MSSRSNAVDAHIGARIRMRRLLLGMTQGELGERVGLSFQQIQKYELGHNRVSASRLLEIARVLEVSPTYVFEGLMDGDARRSPRTEDLIEAFLESKEGLALAAAWIAVDDPAARRSMLELARAFARKADRPAPSRAASNGSPARRG
jgi:transcriptional regulator with XRE-family HTH domain